MIIHEIFQQFLKPGIIQQIHGWITMNLMISQEFALIINWSKVALWAGNIFCLKLCNCWVEKMYTPFHMLRVICQNKGWRGKMIWLCTLYNLVQTLTQKDFYNSSICVAKETLNMLNCFDFNWASFMPNLVR